VPLPVPFSVCTTSAFRASYNLWRDHGPRLARYVGHKDICSFSSDVAVTLHAAILVLSLPTAPGTSCIFTSRESLPGLRYPYSPCPACPSMPRRQLIRSGPVWRYLSPGRVFWFEISFDGIAHRLSISPQSLPLSWRSEAFSVILSPGHSSPRTPSAFCPLSLLVLASTNEIVHLWMVRRRKGSDLISAA